MPWFPWRGRVSGLRGRLFSVMLAASLAAPAPAQDLATLAKQERERRAKVAQEAKAYTDGKDGGAATKPGTVPKGPSAPQSTPPTQTAPPPAPDAQKPVWKARADQARAAITREEDALTALDVQIATQRSDVAPLTGAEAQDPMRLQKRDAVLKGLIAKRETQKEVVAVAKKAMDALEREAKVNGIPPGWLR